MSHYAIFVCGEWLCALSVALFIGAALETLRHRARK